jgi:hypothetical protein
VQEAIFEQSHIRRVSEAGLGSILAMDMMRFSRDHIGQV